MPAPSAQPPDPFDLLGVAETSSDEAIHAAWRHRIRLCHPDNATDDRDRKRRLAMAVALNKARDTLLDPASRADAMLQRQTHTAASVDHTGHPWDGSRWSASYRAGGHAEAGYGWSYERPAAPEAKERTPTSGSLRRRTPILRMLAVLLQIIAWLIVSFLREIRRILQLIFWPT
jgi:curved DNA-binding protein CbpA